MSKQSKAKSMGVRVREALLRLWMTVEDDASVGEFSWPSGEVRDELRDGGSEDKWKALDGVQRVGRGYVKLGKVELSEGLIATYAHGVFTVRRSPVGMGKPGFVGGWTKVIESIPVGATRRPKAERPGPGVQTRNPLDTPDHSDATIQVSWTPGCPTALVTVRAKDQDLAPAQLRSFAGALLEAASDIDGGDASAVYDVYELGMAAERSFGEPKVTQRQLDMMRHATGRKLTGGHRNHYCAVPDTDPFAGWEELVGMGLARRMDVGDGSTTYGVTEAGFRMVYGDVRKPEKRGKR
jgi:hypothetical protein